MTEYLIRFVVGGLIVSAFALIGDVLRPKSFAGLFGAAPSIALVTLALAAWQHGGDYAAIESRSMLIGALALCIYSWIVCQLLMRLRYSALGATSMALVVWLSLALGLQQLLLGQSS
jgi:hypothetical protein